LREYFVIVVMNVMKCGMMEGWKWQWVGGWVGLLLLYEDYDCYC